MIYLKVLILLSRELKHSSNDALHQPRFRLKNLRGRQSVYTDDKEIEKNMID